jgi:iron complex transport system ATP-binding protein
MSTNEQQHNTQPGEVLPGQLLPGQLLPGEFLRVRDVWAGYGRPRGDVVRGVSLSAGPGVTAIIGPNGCGKSTLARVMLGLLAPTRGSVQVASQDVHAMRPASRARVMAFVAQRPGVAFSFSVLDVVRMGCRSRSIALEALAKVGLWERAGDQLAELSVGQQQRVSVARAWAQLAEAATTQPRGPRALVADEPVASMDVAHAIATMDLFREMAHARACVVVIMHDLALTSAFADRVVLMNATGEVAGEGPPREVLTTQRLQSVYNVEFVDAGRAGMMPARVVRG